MSVKIPLKAIDFPAVAAVVCMFFLFVLCLDNPSDRDLLDALIDRVGNIE